MVDRKAHMYMILFMHQIKKGTRNMNLAENIQFMRKKIFGLKRIYQKNATFQDKQCKMGKRRECTQYRKIDFISRFV